MAAIWKNCKTALFSFLFAPDRKISNTRGGSQWRRAHIKALSILQNLLVERKVIGACFPGLGGRGKEAGQSRAVINASGHPCGPNGWRGLKSRKGKPTSLIFQTTCAWEPNSLRLGCWKALKKYSITMPPSIMFRNWYLGAVFIWWVFKEAAFQRRVSSVKRLPGKTDIIQGKITTYMNVRWEFMCT